MTTFPTVRSLTLAFALLALGAAQAGVATPSRDELRDLAHASGIYTLQDGRELVLRARAGEVRVTVGNQATESWERLGPDRLRSPDGRQTLHLHREPTGSVERISLESRR